MYTLPSTKHIHSPLLYNIHPSPVHFPLVHVESLHSSLHPSTQPLYTTYTLPSTPLYTLPKTHPLHTPLSYSPLVHVQFNPLYTFTSTTPLHIPLSIYTPFCTTSIYIPLYTHMQSIHFSTYNLIHLYTLYTPLYTLQVELVAWPTLSEEP